MGAEDHDHERDHGHDQPRRKDRKKYSCAGESESRVSPAGTERREAGLVEMQLYESLRLRLLGRNGRNESPDMQHGRGIRYVQCDAGWLVAGIGTRYSS
jgi:hypothetical protein